MSQVLGSQRPHEADRGGGGTSSRKEGGKICWRRQAESHRTKAATGAGLGWELPQGLLGGKELHCRELGPPDGREVQDIRLGCPGALQRSAWHPSSVSLRLSFLSRAFPREKAPRKLQLRCTAKLHTLVPPPSHYTCTLPLHQGRNNAGKAAWPCCRGAEASSPLERSHAGPMGGGLPETPAAGREASPETTPGRRRLVVELTHFSAQCWLNYKCVIHIWLALKRVHTHTHTHM